MFEQHEAIVRCKDCKHRGKQGFGWEYISYIEWPEDDWRCPGRCDDSWYDHIYPDDWFCANGEMELDND